MIKSIFWHLTLSLAKQLAPGTRLGEQQLAERLFDQIPRTIPFELVAELFELLVWQTNDNGAAIHRAIEAWLRAGFDNRKLLIALHLGAYPFVNPDEMETVLSELAEKNTRVAQRCNELILSRRSNGRAAACARLRV